MVKDPVCGVEVAAGSAPVTRQYMEDTFYFCSSQCASTFDVDSERYARQAGEVEVLDQATTAIDPVCGMEVDSHAAPATRQRRGKTFYFCSTRCAETFDTAHDMLDRL